jgi:hypothetical protein
MRRDHMADSDREIEMEDNGDYTVTFPMTLPTPPADDESDDS